MQLNNFIIFDTEFTSWEGSNKRNWSLNWEFPEIIQCSALKIKRENNIFKIIDEFSVYVKPNKNIQLSNYIIELTGITQKDIDTQGLDFHTFLDDFYTFCGNYDIYSYGNDYHEIKINLDLNEYSYKSKFRQWESKFYDICDILKQYNIDTTKYSSGTIYKYFNLIPDRKIDIHNSYWDVYSIFITLNYLIQFK